LLSDQHLVPFGVPAYRQVAQLLVAECAPVISEDLLRWETIAKVRSTAGNVTIFYNERRMIHGLFFFVVTL